MNSLNQLKQNIVVVGAGITGAFIGFHLSKLGFNCSIVDPETDDSRASYNNPGGINPLHGPGIPGEMSAFSMNCYDAHLEVWDEINHLAEIEFNGRINTRLFVAFSEDEAEQLKQMKLLYDNVNGFSATWLDQQSIREFDSRVSVDVVGGLLTTGNATVNSEKYNRAVLSAAYKLGSKRVVGKVSAVHHDGNNISHVRLDNGHKIACDVLVIATGPWMEKINNILKLSIPVRPVRGELLLIHPSTQKTKHDVTWNHYGIYYRGDDYLWVGGTFDDVAYNCRATASGRDAMLAKAKYIIPELADPLIVKHIAGLRPMTPDGLPVFGKIPGWSNAYIATGGGGKGLLLSAGFGKYLAKLISTDSERYDFQFLSSGRFK